MPERHSTLSASVIEAHVTDHVFGTLTDPTPDARGRDGIGLELELLTGTSRFERIQLSDVERLRAGLGPLRGGSRLSVEPGGQLELSTACFTAVEPACEAAAMDLDTLEEAAARHGIELLSLGSDPVRAPARMVTAPRYTAMETYFDASNDAGRTMMCNTAALQINLGLGNEQDLAQRWRRANVLGPTLIACFANSPIVEGTLSGWQSSRLRTWWALDSTRSKPVPMTSDPVRDWMSYALDARVMLIRDGAVFHPMRTSLTFADWMADGHELGWPTLDDWAYHLTTLFPPVRPKGWLELRMLDALPSPFWHVATAVIHALLTDADAGTGAEQAASSTSHLWVDAAKVGMGHPALAASGRRCFEIALAVLEQNPDDDGVFEAVAMYNDRWVTRGRCPADDVADAWRRTGAVVPDRASPVPPAHRLLAGANRE